MADSRWWIVLPRMGNGGNWFAGLLAGSGLFARVISGMATSRVCRSRTCNAWFAEFLEYTRERHSDRIKGFTRRQLTVRGAVLVMRAGKSLLAPGRTLPDHDVSTVSYCPTGAEVCKLLGKDEGFRR
jgi:hypothetical protein